jgi:putative ABC transport system permease protein
MLKLALRNLARHRMRTGIALAAIVFGVAGLIVSGGFVRDMFIQLGEALIHSQSGHLQLARTQYFSSGSRSPEKHRIDDPERLKALVAASPYVRNSMARIHFSGLVGNGRSDWAIIGEGIEPDREAALATHLRIIHGRALSDRDAFGMMVGQGVAQALGVSPGDRLTLLVNTDEGALNALEFELVGVFQTFSREFDARAVRVPLLAAQEALASRGANVIVVELQHTRDTEAAAADLARDISRQGLAVRTWAQLNDFYEKTVTLYERQFGVLQAIVLAMVLLSVANAVNMSIFERTGEFGTMMALGNRRRFVFRLVVLESALLGLLGSALGAAAGALLAFAISSVGIPMPPPPNANLGYDAYIRIVPAVVVAAAILGVAATVVASLIPAVRVSHLPLAEALRRNV